MHTLLDLRGAIPSFIHISDGKLHDVNVLDLLIPKAGAIYVMDRGYLDFEPLHVLRQAGAGDSATAERSARQLAHPQRAFRLFNRCVSAQS